MPSIAADSVAEAYLALLKARGVDCLFVNAGTDSPSLIEAWARQAESGLALPRPVLCAHENLAVGMAHGYTLASGRVQAVMVHVSVGAANATCGLINAARDQCPMFFTAGRTPIFEEGRFGARSAPIHWAQELFDQGAMLREVVKWDYELRDGHQLESVVDRALAITMTHPRGPVYLTLPREVLAQRLEAFAFHDRAPALPTDAGPDPAAVDQAARWLARSRNPLIVAVASGADPSTVPMLAEIAERFALPVVESRARTVCLPGSHPLHLGFEAEALLDEADAVLFLEADVPWVPRLGRPGTGTRVIQAGSDPLFGRYPMRSHRCDLAITTTVKMLLPRLAQALQAHDDDRLREERRIHWSARAAEVRAAAAAEIAREDGGAVISKRWLSHCLGMIRPPESIVVNEYWLSRSHASFDEPGTFFGLSPAAGLGWGFPAALGVQMACPERTVIATLGDGSYLFGNPAACHQAAAMHSLPVLTVLCNNQRWDAVDIATRRMYPKAHASRHASVPLSSLAPAPDYAKYVQASGGHGETVTRREELPGALARALAVVQRERRQALVDVHCA